MTKLNDQQRAALQAANDLEITTACIRYVWRFWINGRKPVTRTVKALEKRGLLHILYFSGNRAAVNITEIGRIALQKAVQS